MAITKDQIFAVADEIDATGQNPTLAAVRKALGGGSFTTISDAMTEWKARKAAKETPLREPAPPLIAERLVAFGAELWAVALELANARLTTERAALEAARFELEAAKADAAALADQVSVELDEAKARLSAVTEAEQAARTAADTLRAQLNAAAERAATAEARASECSRRADDLNAELARVHQQNTALVQSLADAARGSATGGTAPRV